MRVLLATSWGRPQCGIQSHSEWLIQAVQAADPEIVVVPSEEALDPNVAVDLLCQDCWDVVCLNYHRALHSRWTPAVIHELHKEIDVPFVIVMHDTFGESAPDALCQQLYDLADAFIVHEPCEGLPKAIYWRQGVPVQQTRRFSADPPVYAWERPVVGSVGFDFGWKNYDRLCEIAAAVGWGVLLYVPEITESRLNELHARNPWLDVRINQSTDAVLDGLRRCDATAFLYVNGNSGTSAAIRVGIAAGKPVLAMRTCRQFRDLMLRDGRQRLPTIRWVDSFEDAQEWLTLMPLTRLDPSTIALAEQDSWRHLGAKYAALYRSLVSA